MLNSKIRDLLNFGISSHSFPTLIHHKKVQNITSKSLRFCSISSSFSTVKQSHEQIQYYSNRLKNLNIVHNEESSQTKSQDQSKTEQFKQTKFTYPPFKPTLSLKLFNKKYAYLKEQQESEGNISKAQEKFEQKISGRISSIRKHGKTIFIDIREEHEKVQIAMKVTEAMKSGKLQDLEFQRGDIVGVRGRAFVTKKGELSMEVAPSDKQSQSSNSPSIQLLSPCLWMLPEYNNLKSAQTRFRHKHLDLITNPSSLQTIKKRSIIIKTLRSYLEEKQFIEVQTPILMSTYGGAVAKPFITLHNEYKASLYMRIAPELYLKQLIIGGMSKVFQIGKNFRNQGVDQTHNPEFTTCELYSAYSDVNEMMGFTVDLIREIVKKVNGDGSMVIRCKKKSSSGASTDSSEQQQIYKNQEFFEIDLSKEWKVYDFVKDLEIMGNLKLPLEFESEQSRKYLDDLCIEHSVECEAPRTSARLLDKLASKYLQESIHEPFFIINQPRVLSPLAKPHLDNPNIVQRFELFINGWEIVNSYTELNNPLIQKQNTPQEESFIEALEYGLPPTAGWGIGIDRLVMLLTGHDRIQEVIGFPLLRKDLAKQKLEQNESVK